VATGTLKLVVENTETLFVGVKVIDDGHFRAGGAASITVTGNWHDFDRLPLLTAVHVTIVVVVTKNRVLLDGLHTRLWIPDPSVADTAVMKGTSTSGRLSELVDVYVKLVGHDSDGAAVTTIDTLNEQVLFRPALLEALHTTVVVPRGNV